MKEHIVGKWWYDNYLVTFYPDGRFSSSNPKTPGVEHDAYWRVETDGTLLITETKDALPGGNFWNDEVFILDHMTGTEMFFQHPDVAGEMTFSRATSETAPEPARR